MTAARSFSTAWLLSLLLLLTGLSAGAGPGRSPARPLPNHPGNIFVVGESVEAELPPASSGPTGSWQLSNYEGALIASGEATNGRVFLGALPAGYYEMRRASNGVPLNPRVPLAVLPPLRVSPPRSSPLGLDVNLANLCDDSQLDAAVNLCALAGVTWVRERFSWRALQPVPGKLAPPGKYDAVVRKEAEAGLQVLQVFNDSPAWANPNWKRLPADLRHAAGFLEAVARRWKGQVQAFEPWNEGDIPVFGGHSGMELAAYQKACCFGLKAGNPDVIVCQNAFGSPHPNVLQDFAANQAAAYFDTLNFHHYTWPEEFPALYSAFRGVAAGKPLWTTEFCVPVAWVNGTEPNKECTDPDLRVQAERVPRLFASTLYYRPAVAFYFMLMQYAEVQSLYGVLHRDLTPRPAYLALAAVGRLLPDAKPVGRLGGSGPVRAFAFQARPDGESRDVLVAWSEQGEALLPLKVRPLERYDLLGRVLTNQPDAVRVSSAPQFLICRPGELSQLPLEPPPAVPAPQPDRPCPVVLQALIPKERLIDSLSAYTCSPATSNAFSVFAYNFGSKRLSGKLSVAAPPGWSAYLPAQVELAPGDRRELTLTVVCPRGCVVPAETLTIQGDFGGAGQAVLAVRFTTQPFVIVRGPDVKIPGASQTNRWQVVAPPGTRVAMTPGSHGELSFRASFPAAERWVYPALDLAPTERAPTNAVAIALTLHSVEGRGQFRVLFQEENQSVRFADFFPQPQLGETVESLAVLTNALFGEGWSPPDDNGKLDFDKIKTLRIGCNTTNDKAAYSIQDVRWLIGNAP